jgi:two-component system, LuxR family, response regulator FixJ
MLLYQLERLGNHENLMKIRKKQYDVFFVDDEPKIREVVANDLEDLGCKVRCFANAADCLGQLPKQNCNLLITDVKMPGMDGMTLLSRTKHVAPWVSVMVITGFGDIQMAVKAIKLGAVDFVEKPLERKIFLHKVQSILAKDDFINAPVSKPLTKTEKKVLKLILDGEGNKQIGQKFQRALRSIERHRSSIMHKFRVDNIVDLVKKATLINLDDVE